MIFFSDISKDLQLPDAGVGFGEQLERALRVVEPHESGHLDVHHLQTLVHDTGLQLTSET